jgi:hypothetical protein
VGRYSNESISKFVLGLIKININEKSGTGSGWTGIETLIIELMSC